MTAAGSAQAADPPADDREFKPDPTVAALISVAANRFLNLGFLAEAGTLDLRLDGRPLHGIRVELPRGQLGLQSIGIEADGEVDVTRDARVRTSSRHPDLAEGLDTARLFDFEDPSGTVVQTRADHPAWLDITFARPAAVTRIRLRNVMGDKAPKARTIRVATKSRWRRHVIYDAGRSLKEWGALVAGARAETAPDEPVQRALDALDSAVRAKYDRARRIMRSRTVDEDTRRWFAGAMNEALLPARGLEWTVHGPSRSFRSWTEAERRRYVDDGARVVDALHSLTPNACFGFGSVLAVVRDHALIPHDDDIDLIVAFEPDEAPTIADGLRRVEQHLRGLGFEVDGEFSAHRHVRPPGRKSVDVFVGMFEGDAVSWYPAARGGLTRDVVFPTSSAPLLGVTCPIPAKPEVYLERIYGATWRVPDPYFNHPWNLTDYADIKGTQAPTLVDGADADPDPDAP